MKYLLNVDGLLFVASTEINLNNYLSGSIYKFPNGLFLEKETNSKYSKRAYSYYFKIQYKGKDYGHLYTKTMDLSYSSGFNILVWIANKTFYTESLDFINKLIFDALKVTKSKISRLDISYDTDTNILSEFKRLYYNPTVKFRWKGKINVNGTGDDDLLLPIGSLSGRVKSILIYNKTKELIKKDKEYIRNVHNKVFGINVIYRIELRIMSKTLELKDINILNLDNTEYLELIYNTYFDDLIYFTDINTNNKIEYITLNNTANKLSRAVKQKIKCGGKQVKAFINFLDKESKSTGFTGLMNAWKLIRSALLKKYGLETWYLTRH